jgi:hypothetical protein
MVGLARLFPRPARPAPGSAGCASALCREVAAEIEAMAGAERLRRAYAPHDPASEA